MMKWVSVFLILQMSSSVFATSIKKYFKAKEWQKIVDIYQSNKKASFTEKEFGMISEALRNREQFREDISLNIRFIRIYFNSEHSKLMKEIRSGASTDSEQFSDALKHSYWSIINDLAQIIKGIKKKSPEVEKDFKQFQMFSKIMEALEFNEGKTDKLVSNVQSHMIYLEEKIYRFSGSLVFNYISWQSEVNLQGTETAKLLVTNRGYCLGGDAGVENYRYHFFVDGCLLIGSGEINNKDAQPEYQQSNVPSYGLKAGPGASVIVSSSKSRIGLKIPFVYTIQNFEEPSPTSGNNYTVKQKSPLTMQVSLYSRFNLNAWFIQTEIGQYIGNDEIFWGLGFGKSY